MSGISWTKGWTGSDDGMIIGGIDLRNIQDDLAPVLVLSDIGVLVKSYTDPGTHIFWENEIISYENETVFIT